MSLIFETPKLIIKINLGSPPYVDAKETCENLFATKHALQNMNP